MKNLLYTLCLLFLISQLNAQIDTTLSNQFQQFLLDQQNDSGDNGISATIIMPNGDSWNGAVGLDRDGNPITETTTFYGASTIKPAIATIILQLEEDGLLSINDSLASYLAPIDHISNSITIKELMNHTSGVYNFSDHPNFLTSLISNPTQAWTPEEVLATYVNQEPLFPAGTSYSYSNTNYLLLSLIIESLTDNPLHVVLRNRIWNPLNMSNTYLGHYESSTEAQAGIWADPFGTGTLQDFNSLSHTALLSQVYGAGAIVTTPSDEAVFVRALLQGQLLSDSSMQKMQTLVSTPGFDPLYGLGLDQDILFPNDTIWGHSGDLGNYTWMYHSISQDYTVVTMTNTAPANSNGSYAFYLMNELLHSNVAVATHDLLADELEIAIFPNPAKEILYLEKSSITDELDLQINILNIEGKVLYNSAFQNEININSFPTGIYQLQVISEKGVFNKRFMKI